MYRSGNYVAAAGVLQDLAPSPDSLRLLGLCLLRQGRAADSLGPLQRAHAMVPNDPWAKLHLGLGLQTLGRHAEAVLLFRASHAALPDDPAPLLNLAASLLTLDDIEGALHAASEACHMAPRRPEAHYTYGLALLAANLVGRAAQAFTATVQLAPQLVDGWLNLGVAHYRLNDMPSAIAATWQVLRLAPFHRAATANLGAFLRLTGCSETAETLLRDLLARDPQASEARLNLAADLLNEDRPAEALALLNADLPESARQRVHWQLQQALALLQLGRVAEAGNQLAGIDNVPPVLVPQFLFRQVLLAVAEGRRSDAAAFAIRMEAEIGKVGRAAVPEHRIMGHFGLAKFWSGRNAHGHAFSHWVRGHKLLSQFQPFPRDAHRAAVDATIAAFSAARLAAGNRAKNTDPRPVFIVGMPRSGTTLAERILSAHAQVHGAGERSALADSYVKLGGAGFSAAAAQRIVALGAPPLDAEAGAYLDSLQRLAPHAARIIDKMPGNFVHLGLIGLMFPGARIIHCRRDPRDIGLSIFTFRFHGHHPYAHDLADLGWYITEHDRLCAHWRRVLPNPMMELHLHDWVEDFDKTLSGVLHFLDLPHDPACAQFHTSETRAKTVSRQQVRQRINGAGLGRWRAYERYLGPMITELAAGGSLPKQTHQ
jgi:tetratricopeptide (TPR) repeat protein